MSLGMKCDEKIIAQITESIIAVLRDSATDEKEMRIRKQIERNSDMHIQINNYEKQLNSMKSKHRIEIRNIEQDTINIEQEIGKMVQSIELYNQKSRKETEKCRNKMAFFNKLESQYEHTVDDLFDFKRSLASEIENIRKDVLLFEKTRVKMNKRLQICITNMQNSNTKAPKSVIAKFSKDSIEKQETKLKKIDSITSEIMESLNAIGYTGDLEPEEIERFFSHQNDTAKDSLMKQITDVFPDFSFNEPELWKDIEIYIDKKKSQRKQYYKNLLAQKKKEIKQLKTQLSSPQNVLTSKPLTNNVSSPGLLHGSPLQRRNNS